jgi:hypothetical protein
VRHLYSARLLIAVDPMAVFGGTEECHGWVGRLEKEFVRESEVEP